MKNTSHRLIILTGPSGVGKSPLQKAIKRLFPELHQNLVPLVLYNSRPPRPGEQDGIDYHFRTRGEIEALRAKDNYVVMDVRGDLQALDLNVLLTHLKDNEVFFEGNPFIGKVLLMHPGLSRIEKLPVFMSPLSQEEIISLKDPSNHISLTSLVTDVMRRKLLRRTKKQKGVLSLKDLENIEQRAASAFGELQTAYLFDYIIPNHDGEDSEHWDAFYYPIGDARKALLAFAALLKKEDSDYPEHWEANTMSWD
ncbi:hypothetical protein DMA11_21895 [Marinilabiliaceae bacterium JC017]|nr:hypothetical protein DMA11_21895 [Marinilabiliaceae bacterium JC017]